MRLEDTDWDNKPTDEVARIVAVNAGMDVKALGDLRNPFVILALVLAWSLYRVMAGSWL
ncbi:MAG: hypothetical protein ABW026_18165 [Microvirga sp.]